MTPSLILAGPPNRGRLFPGAPFSAIRIGYVVKLMKLHGPERLAYAPRPPSEGVYAMPTESFGHPPRSSRASVLGQVGGKSRSANHGGSEHARRSAVGAQTPFPHELNHGETEKGDPLWGRGTAFTVWLFHEGFGGHFMEVWTRFMEVWIHGGFSVGGARNSAPPWTGTHTLAVGI